LEEPLERGKPHREYDGKANGGLEQAACQRGFQEYLDSRYLLTGLGLRIRWTFLDLRLLFRLRLPARLKRLFG
jgi:hypothetical protein